MREVLVFLVLVLATASHAATYYVSSSGGSDSNNATQAQNSATPWRTLAKTSGAVAAGDTILLKRGDAWNETLAVSQNNLTIDAFGTGRAPRITGYQVLSGWVNQGNNVWKSMMTAGSCSILDGTVLFDGVIGQRKTSGATGPVADRDYYCDGATPSAVYVYSTSTPTNVAAITPSGSGNALISINGKSGITIQHLQLDYFDSYGVNVSGAATNLTFANMSVNGLIIPESPNVTVPSWLPYGFYVNTGTNATTIKFVNADAHLNFDGFRIWSYGAGSNITMVGCRAFANRDLGLWDTGTAVNYSYSHFYANGIAAIESTDVSGGTPGTGNIAQNVSPVIQGMDRFPAVFSFTVDDVGLSGAGTLVGGAFAGTSYASSEDYIDTLTPVFESRGLHMNMAVTTGYAVANAGKMASEFTKWLAGGHEVDSHSWSHQYYTLTNGSGGTGVFNIQYKDNAPGSSATMTIQNNVLHTSVAGASAQNMNVDISNMTLQDFLAYVQTNYPNYTINALTTRTDSPIKMATLADVTTAVAIKGTVYTANFDLNRFWTSEMADSKSWLAQYLPSPLPPMVYVYPGGWNTTQSDTIAQGSGYVGARGQISMHPPDHTTASPKYAADFTATGRGVDVYNIISLTPAGWHTATQTQADRAVIDSKLGALIFKMKAWGLPAGLFVHNTDLMSPREVGWILDAILARHGQIKKNAEIVAYAQSGRLVLGTTQYLNAAIGPVPNMRTAPASPDAGKVDSTLAAVSPYAIDMAGNTRTGTLWDIGAYVSRPWGSQFAGGMSLKRTTYGRTSQSAGGTSENAYCLQGDIANFGSMDGPANLPQECTYTALAGTPSNGTVRTVAADGSNLQATINAAACGDVVLTPNTKIVGRFTVSQDCDAGHWLTIKSAGASDPTFPAESVQLTPCHANKAHVDGYPDYACANPGQRTTTISTNYGSSGGAAYTVTGSYIRFIGQELTKEKGVSFGQCLLNLDGSDHVIFDRGLIHGDPWSAAPAWDTHCGVSTRGVHLALINSWVYDIDWDSPEGTAFTGGVGTNTDEGPIKVYNNVMAAASETWLIGGGATRAYPHDYEIRRNLSMKPLLWMLPVGTTSYNASVNAKNLGEFKIGHRILYEDNIFMNTWEGQSDQYGNALVMVPKNQASTISSKRANTNGTQVSCAVDATGTACAKGTGVWGNYLTSMSRTGGVLTVNGSNNGASPGWPYLHFGANIVLQGIPAGTMTSNGIDLATFNGEWQMGCLSDSTCTDGYSMPRVIYIEAPGPDFPLTNLPSQTAIAQEFTTQTCAIPGHCHFDAPNVAYPANTITSVIDVEHITVAVPYGVQTGVTHTTCRVGDEPDAQIEDFVIRNNYITHTQNLGMTFANAVSSCGDASKGISKISVHDNVFDDNSPDWTRGNSCCGYGGKGMNIYSASPDLALMPHDILIAHNTGAGQRGWPGTSPRAAGAFGFGDSYDYSYTGSTLQRINNLVTITHSSISGDPVASQFIVTGFTGDYADLNGTWDVYMQLDTSVQFVESGSHPDINPAISIAAGTTGVAHLAPPSSYYRNVTFRDNIGPSPVYANNWNGSLDNRGLLGMLNLNMCDPVTHVCSWIYKNNLLGTALYPGYPQNVNTNIPVTNPDGSSACTLLGGCSVTDFSNVFTNWGADKGMGNTSGNDYTVTAAYRNAGSDGKDIGADMNRFKTLKSTLLPTFTFAPLSITTSTLTDCVVNTYCEQQVLWTGGPSHPYQPSFVQMHITSGTLPAGMKLANNDATDACKVNGSMSKTGIYGCVGWIWGTPTQTGSFPLTITAEDAAHQKASVNLTLTVN